MASTIVEVSEKNWDKMIMQSSMPVFVMFHSPTCSHCINIKPHFEKYADEFKETVLFASIDVSKNQKIAATYGVMGTPTFSFICHGKIVNGIVGSVYPTLLKKTVEDGLQFGENCRSKTTWFDQGITGYA